MKKITSLDHAQQVLGVTINLESFKELIIPEKDKFAIACQYALWFITEANNKLNNWVADWNDNSQPKYSVWAPRVIKNAERPAGLGLAFRDADYWYADTYCGARLNVGSAAEAKYIFEDFIEKWDHAWLIQEK